MRRQLSYERKVNKDLGKKERFVRLIIVDIHVPATKVFLPSDRKTARYEGEAVATRTCTMFVN